MQNDHVELLVPDRDVATARYGEWLGFRTMPEHEAWAQTGPIMLTNDAGATMLALFKGESPGRRSSPCGWGRVAFRMVGREFIKFTNRFLELGPGLEGPVNHEKAGSVSISAPWANAFEVTTHGYEDERRSRGNLS